MFDERIHLLVERKGRVGAARAVADRYDLAVEDRHVCKQLVDASDQPPGAPPQEVLDGRRATGEHPGNVSDVAKL